MVFHGVVDAGGEAADHVLRVEIRETFTTNGASEYILMHVNQGEDSSGTELVNESFNLNQIIGVINTLSLFNGFPHDTETDEVEAPVDQVLDILVIQ